jgi:hypothetical protein
MRLHNRDVPRTYLQESERKTKMEEKRKDAATEDPGPIEGTKEV